MLDRTEDVHQQLAKTLNLNKALVVSGHDPPEFVLATMVEPVQGQE